MIATDKIKQPIGGSPSAENFFSYYLALPLVLALYFFWKVWSRNWTLYVRAADMDITSGRRAIDLSDDYVPTPKTWKNMPIRAFHALF